MTKRQEMEIVLKELSPFMNEFGQLTALPARFKKRLYFFYYLSKKFEHGVDYTESEVNRIINDATVFDDPATIRRELYNLHLINRTPDCSKYWKAEDIPPLTEFMTMHI